MRNINLIEILICKHALLYLLLLHVLLPRKPIPEIYLLKT